MSTNRIINLPGHPGAAPYHLPPDDDLIAFRDTPPNPPDWVIEGLEAGDVGLLTAPGGVGKSMLCLSLAMAVASGQALFGQWQVGAPGDVLYLYAEDSTRVMHRRFYALSHQNGITDPIINRLHFICVRNNPPKIMIRGQQGLVQPQNDVIHAILAEVQQYPRPRLIILDPMLKFHTLEENANNEMNQFLDLLGQLGEAVGAAILITHHTTKGKSTDTGDLSTQEASRGAGAIVNEARWQASLKPIGPKMIAKLGLDDDQGWRYLTLSIPKRNSTGRLSDILLERGMEGILMAVGGSSLASPRTPDPHIEVEEEGIPVDYE
ncbi:MAG: helicase RepA family protein [Firmicutes bacterium]|jgi:RecA-family ATPase|nr:helicase RepA family protein [Bacillota bacterium]